MAWNRKLGGGPYPNLKDEYCGNHDPTELPIAACGQTPEQALDAQRRYLEKMRLGRPHPARGKTTEELEAAGVYGLYLKESRDLFDFEEAVPTPDSLREPVR